MSDAALFGGEGFMGLGVVALDHKGSFLVACRQRIQGLLSPEEAEALALQRAVQLAQEEGYDKVVFTSDCLSLIQRLKSGVMDQSNAGILVSGIKEMTISFTSVSFSHVSRILNVAAHTLAKSCVSFASSEVFYSVPDCIRGTSCNDMF
jgi:ribonuclease HI